MGLLSAIDRAWGWVLWALMGLAGIYIGLMMVAVVYITVFRYFEWDYSPFTRAFIIYGFIYVLFLGSPWMIRHRGHVYIELLTAAVPNRVRDSLSRLIAFLSAVICLVWTWFTWGMFMEHWGDEMAFDELRGDLDLHRWITTIAFPIGFGLMAIEFMRYVVVREPMHVGEAGVASDRSELEEQQRMIDADRVKAEARARSGGPADPETEQG